jgi:L-alanine-DL-glutamate epimerase-like enolase superfamily enzyme
MPWFFPAFGDPPTPVSGRLMPPQRSGLGLEVRSDAIEKYRLKF